MKRISGLPIICLLCAAALAQAQDATPPAPAAPAAAVPAGMSAQEIVEDYKVLKGQVQDMIDAQAAQEKRLQAMAKEISELRDQLSKPNTEYASQEELKRLADAIQDIDRKRIEDYQHLTEAFAKLGKVIATTEPASRSSARPVVNDPGPSTPKGDEPGYTYQIKSGDTFSLIAQAYREQGVKVTSEQIEKANPGINPAKLKVGQKIFIPATKTTAAK